MTRDNSIYSGTNDPRGDDAIRSGDSRMAAANENSGAGGTRSDVGMSTTSGVGTGVPTRGAPPHSGSPSEPRPTGFPHAGLEFALVPSGHEEWRIEHPDGRTVGVLAIISHAGEEAEAVFVTRRAGSEDAVAEGTDWRGLVSAVINDEAADQRGPVQIDPTVEHVRGGLITRGPAD
ncbi:hypothetical protein [Rathayibacter tanaceti]|uniref:Uncharacterized protein n=2 Tax=Rathayibacter tanaceti TaxID=1671680 RepID=A0A162F8J7_9MICO|nr:hypothetical protein [Rathayibacter tanaceti]KZX20503.1 hypothetical protein ACH61_02396 [Rathayibacter tanaceti]QHC55268.1 hypothetical protein GSU10_06235 [Rathayibacter tanaceti]TCO36436.1 hypothetical protein EV639_107115 [Rathayibacter tanaceti]